MKNKLIFALLVFFVLGSHRAYSREFLDTIFHINLGVAYGFPSGSVIDYEEQGFDYGGKTLKPDHYASSFGITIDIAPFKPIILGNEAHAVKFGVRTGYKKNFIDQTISDGQDVDDMQSLITYQTFMAGPVLHYSPKIGTSDLTGEFTAKGGFTMYALFGKLLFGEYSAYPARRFRDTTLVGDFDTRVSGYKLDLGVGAVIAICSVNVGINLFYSYINYNLDEQIYTTLPGKGSINQYTAEFYIGIPIEWFRNPRIF